jgi:ribosomal-protein-alanine N-acetyltransferase
MARPIDFHDCASGTNLESISMMNAVLETERMLLRAFTLDDVEAMFVLGSDPDIIRYAGNTPFKTVDDARSALIAGTLRDYEIYGYGRFACVLKESGKVIGFSGIKYLDEIEENELGYRFLPQYWGLGLAKEAARVVIPFAREKLKMSRLVSVIHPDNAGSKNVVAKLGFRYEKNTHLSLVTDSHMELFSTAI